MTATATAPRAYILEDDPDIAALEADLLREMGFSVVTCTRIVELGDLIDLALPHLLVIDVMLPDGDGYSFCRQLRDTGQYMPVIMLTARSAAEDRVRGLDSGADDYMPKPFDLTELLARVRSALRRSGWRRQDTPAEPGGGVLRFGEASIDFETHEALMAGKPVRLTQLELDLVQYFARHPGRVLSREELLEQVWNLRNAPNTRSVDNFIARLRKCFEPLPDKPVFFLSHRGAGYRFVPDGGSKKA